MDNKLKAKGTETDEKCFAIKKQALYSIISEM